MKLSQTTRNLLLNYAGYNHEINFYSGNRQAIMTPAKSLLLVSEVEESFPINCTLRNLNSFNKILSLNKNADIHFTESEIIVVEGRYSTRFKVTKHDEVIKEPRKLEFPESWTTISYKTFEKLNKLANAIKPKINRLSKTSSLEPYLSFYSQDGDIYADIEYSITESEIRQTSYIGKGNLDGRLKVALKDFKPMREDYKLQIGKIALKLTCDKIRTSVYWMGKSE